MIVTVNHPDLSSKELPAGISPNAVAIRKKRLAANGVGYEIAEQSAIEAEIQQATKNGADKIVASADVSSTFLPDAEPSAAMAADTQTATTAKMDQPS